MNLDDLWIPAAMAAAILPLFSALLLSKGKRGYAFRYLRCLAAYVVVWLLVSVGYLVQGSLPSPMRSIQYSNVSGWEFARLLVMNEYQQLSNLASTILAASVICFSLLIGDNQRSRSTNTFRAGFVALMALDLLFGMETGFTGTQYIYNLAFNLFGAFLLSVFAPFFVARLIPASNDLRRD